MTAHSLWRLSYTLATELAEELQILLKAEERLKKENQILREALLICEDIGEARVAVVVRNALAQIDRDK